jgi:hypothetical protein
MASIGIVGTCIPLVGDTWLEVEIYTGMVLTPDQKVNLACPGGSVNNAVVLPFGTNTVLIRYDILVT